MSDDVTSTTLLGSASKLHRSLECPASTLLPQTEKPFFVRRAGDRGTAIHRFYQLAPDEGFKALEEVPEQYHEECRRMKPEQFASRFTPLHHREQAFAYDAETGKMRDLDAGEHRDYGELKETEIPGTFDVIVKGFGMAEVWDLKTGKTQVPAPEVNPQLLHGALAVSELVSPRADRFLLGIQNGPDQNGDLNNTTGLVDRWALDEHAGRIRLATRKARVVQAAIEAGEVPPVNPGSWCRFCDARKSCPSPAGKR